jgi:nickel/cobalt transporter (NicO) family protein
MDLQTDTDFTIAEPIRMSVFEEKKKSAILVNPFRVPVRRLKRMRARSILAILVVIPVVLACSTMLVAHPLGNFSVNHYMRFEAVPGGVEMRYAMDLAEIPTFELLRSWGMERTSSRGDLDRKAVEQARLWMDKLVVQIDGKPVQPTFEDASLAIVDGAGSLPILRITSRMRIGAKGGRLQYEDHNFEGRAGWKEIVIAAAPGARLESASQTDQDRSQALTAYPPDPMVAPPQDLRAEFEWTADTTITTTVHPAPHSGPAKLAVESAAPVIQAIPQPAGPVATPPAAALARNAPAGTVVKNDFLSRLLHREKIPLNMVLIALVIAFGLGGAHALTPGHGKTIVAAYLVGSRGTLKHAAFLGAMVTVTHTVSVFALGLATLFLFRLIVPEKITEILGVISGLSIAVIGGWMLLKRFRGAHGHHHTHHQYSHKHSHGHPDHDSHDHLHHDGPGGHTHVPEGDVSWGSLVTLAVSGGLVPCESALVLLLSAISLGRVGLGLLLLLAFSLGLAGVLMGIGVTVLYAKRLLPERSRIGHGPFVRWAPVASAVVVFVIGVLMTSVSLGWLPSGWQIG